MLLVAAAAVGLGGTGLHGAVVWGGAAGQGGTAATGGGFQATGAATATLVERSPDVGSSSSRGSCSPEIARGTKRSSLFSKRGGDLESMLLVGLGDAVGWGGAVGLGGSCAAATATASRQAVALARWRRRGSRRQLLEGNGALGGLLLGGSMQGGGAVGGVSFDL